VSLHHLQVPTEFSKDSHPKFAPTPQLPPFLVQGVHYLEG